MILPLLNIRYLRVPSEENERATTQGHVFNIIQKVPETVVLEKWKTTKRSKGQMGKERTSNLPVNVLHPNDPQV